MHLTYLNQNERTDAAATELVAAGAPDKLDGKPLPEGLTIIKLRAALVELERLEMGESNAVDVAVNLYRIYNVEAFDQE